jgi:hypothetical protein
MSTFLRWVSRILNSSSVGVPKSPDEEAGEMSQMAHGPGVPAPVHPNDNDQEHIDFDLKDMASPEFMSMGAPNYEGRRAHVMMHQQAMAQKQQAVMNVAAPPAGQQAPQQAQQGPALGQERIEPQLQGTGNMGAMGDASQASNGKGAGLPNMENAFGN